MATTTDILDAINADALAFQQAKAKYDTAFRQFSVSVPPLAPEHFWPMADEFRLLVLQTMLYRDERVADAAADEFFRQAVVGDLNYSLSEVVHFALSWNHYKRLAYKGGDSCHFGFERGDDGYGDLMDAAVLLGRKFNERLYEGRFYNLPDFNDAVNETCIESVTKERFSFQYADDPTGNRLALVSRLRKMVLFGENYFAMSLEDNAQKWVAYEAMKKAREEHGND